MGSTQVRAAVSVVILAVVSVGGDARQSVLSLTLEQGKYAVGFRALIQNDGGRAVLESTGETTSRSIQTSIWYPARPTRGAQKMRYKEYVDLAGMRPDNQPLTHAEATEVEKRFVASLNLTDEKRIIDEFEAPTNAVRNAAEAPGRFPVIIYGPSLNAPSWENSDLAEYLAGQGFVVISSPSMGWYTRSMTNDLIGAEAQTLDMEFLLRFASSLDNADMSRVAVMGFSWGGLSNVMVQYRNPTIRAVVCLDGSIRAFYNKLFKAWSFADVSRMDVPILFLNSKQPPPEIITRLQLDPTFVFFDSLRYAQAYRLDFNELVHQNFGAWFIRLLPRDASIGEADQKIVNRGFAAISQYTLNFLNAFLRDDPEGRAFLERDPEQNGLPPHFVSVTRKQPIGPAPTLASFARYAGFGGLARADSVLTAIRERDSDYRLPEREVNGWAYQLLEEQRYPEAIGVFRMNAVMYPDSGNVYDSLAEAFMAAGDRDRAIENYERALQLDPTNTNAKQRLLTLRRPKRLPG